MIELKNIDLSKVSIYEQISKVAEEENEFMEALGLVQKLGIDANEVMKYYPKHLEKTKNRPR